MKKGLTAAFLLVGLGALAYWNTLSARFVYDDDSFVVLNPAIRTLAHPQRFFTDPGTLAADPQLAHDNYRPLTTLSFALNYRFAGLDPKPYHLTNLVLHLANALLVLLLALALLEGNPLFAFVAAALFLLHPLQTESVAWVSQRSGLLSMFFMLLSWHAYLRGRDRGPGWKFLSLALFIASLLSK